MQLFYLFQFTEHFEPLFDKHIALKSRTISNLLMKLKQKVLPKSIRPKRETLNIEIYI